MEKLFRIKKIGEYIKDTEIYSSLSSEVRELLDQMLRIRPDDRFTAEDILDSDWMDQ